SRRAPSTASSSRLRRPPGTPHALRYDSRTSRTRPSSRVMKTIAPTEKAGEIDRTMRRRAPVGSRRYTRSAEKCRRSRMVTAITDRLRHPGSTITISVAGCRHVAGANRSASQRQQIVEQLLGGSGDRDPTHRMLEGDEVPVRCVDDRRTGFLANQCGTRVVPHAELVDRRVEIAIECAIGDRAEIECAGPERPILRPAPVAVRYTVQADDR